MDISSIMQNLMRNLTPPVVIFIYNKLNMRFQIVLARKKLGRYTKLHIACGSNVIDGWANIDRSHIKNVIRLDLTMPLPVRSETIRFIYSEHFIEHISLEQAKTMLGECYRILQPGGVLRLSTPSLRKLVDEYISKNLSEWSDIGWNPSTPCRMMNEGIRLWEHQFVYDTDELEHLLEEIGFCNVTHVTWRESKYEELQGLECRPFHGEIILESVK
jgi:predicted SAM-dependent methyltransferase